MGTKALVVAALLALAASSTVVAQTTNVYSDNAVGYYQISFQPGQFKMIANQLNTTNNRISSVLVLPDANAGTQVWKWTGATYTSAIWQGVVDGWTQPNLSLNPGEGCFIKLAGPGYTHTFVGEIMQGWLTNNLPLGLSIRSSMVPEAGDADTLGLLACLGDTIYRFNQPIYHSAIYQGPPDGWTSSTFVGVGEAFFYKSTCGQNWVRQFSVNN